MNAIGIDIGGTFIKGAVVTPKGDIQDFFTLPVEIGETPEETINKLIIQIKKINYPNINGVGIGCPGTVDSDTGVVEFAPNIGWTNVHIKEMIEEALDLPVHITNDANAAASGEATFGVAKQLHNIVVLTLGTGVGGGLVLDGKLYEGNEGKGAEIGHMVIEIDGRPCGCGRHGCLETYASATALITDTKKQMEQHPDSLMWKGITSLDEVDAKVAFSAAKIGDRYAQEVVRNYIHYLGEGILNLCNIFRPDAVILCGGVSKEGGYLTSRLKNYCEERSYGFPHSPTVEILVGKLGYNAGVVGAASLFFKQ